METLKDIVVYILKKYPYRSDLSNARLTKMIYLADWRSSLNSETQISDINWFYDHYGPYVNDVINLIQSDSDMNVKHDSTIFGETKTVISLKNLNIEPDLSKESQDTINYVIEKTEKMQWNQFIKLVYSTYPIIATRKYHKLDLVQLAKDFAI
jgi:hypothetical protein